MASNGTQMAASAVVRVLELERVRAAFGVREAAINPLCAAMRPRNPIRYILASHVEGASHVAEGYTRASTGNIGVCIGTFGQADVGREIDAITKFKNLALSAARSLGIGLPNAATCQELFNACAAHGGGTWDHSTMVRALEIMVNHQITGQDDVQEKAA